LSKEKAHILLEEGIAAAKVGDKTLAYRIFKEVTKLDSGGELGWLWLAGVSETPQEAVMYLERVLEINPSNEHAQSGLKWAQAKIEKAHEEHEEETTNGRHCLLCLSIIPGRMNKCPVCGAFLSLSDLDRLLNNTKIDREAILAAIERYERMSEIGPDFYDHLALALAYLNLNQVDEGIAHLQLAINIRPDDSELQAQLEQLSLRLAAGEIAAEDDEKQRVVLVVDDSPTICKLVEITLEKHGYYVVTAADGLEGLARISERMPDLILLDITMPRMDGYQLCKTIKGNRETENIPVIMLSGKDGFFDKVKGRMAGSSDYITKPFEPKELVEFVEAHINHKDV
jgi:twitching motility two-component system response regulator PilG